MADEAPETVDTVTVEDLEGNEIEVPVGLDGENPVSPNNPPLKAVPEAEREAAVEARRVELKHAEEEAEISGAGKEAASTNKEDNSPAVHGEDAEGNKVGSSDDSDNKSGSSDDDKSDSKSTSSRSGSKSTTKK